ncbi:MAG: hypothetical protein ACOH12_00460 [Parvibaculaceae bacterium]
MQPVRDLQHAEGLYPRLGIVFLAQFKTIDGRTLDLYMETLDLVQEIMAFERGCAYLYATK